MYLLRVTMFALICFNLSMPSWGYFIERRTVRLIYFLPNDRPYRAEVVQKMKDEISDIQRYYASQMQAHGYGRRTFRVENNRLGGPAVYRVDGEHPDEYYLNDTMLVWQEIPDRLKKTDSINFIVVDNSKNKVNKGDGSGAVPGFAALGGPWAFVSGDFGWKTAAHELGHTFHLEHDFRDNTNLMSYGHPAKPQLSACATQFLAVSPTFNPQIRDRSTERSTVKLLSPEEYPTDAESVKIQLEVSDPDGLHQVFLMLKTAEPHRAAGSYEIKACHGLNGEKKAIVTFDYDGVIPSRRRTSLSDPQFHPIRVQTVDTFSNISVSDVVLFSETLPLVPTHRRTISGNEQRGVVNTPLADPFVIELEDQIGRKLAGWPVRFVVTTGDGTLSAKETETDANGRARTTLTLGSTQGVNTVEAIISGLDPLIFTSFGIKKAAPTLVTDNNYQTLSLPVGAIGRFGKGEVRAVTFSPDGNMFAVGSSAGIWLYDAETQGELALLTGDTHTVSSVVFSPDGTKLIGIGNTVKLWSIPTEDNLATFTTFTESEYIESAAFLPDGTLIATGSSYFQFPNRTGRILLWDVGTQRNVATFHADIGIIALASSPDGKTLASGSRDGKVKILDVETGKNRSLAGHADSRVLAIAYSPDGTKIASVGEYPDNTIKLWDAATGNRIRTMRAHNIRSIAFSPDGTKIVSGEGPHRQAFGRISLWDVETGRRITTLFEHRSDIWSVAFSLNGTKIISGWTDNTIKLWDIPSDTAIATLEHTHFSTVASSPNHTTFAATTGTSTSERQKIKLWNVATGQNTHTLEGHRDRVRLLTFSSDGATLASATWDGELKLWNTATGQDTHTLIGHRNDIWSLAFSPDGETLASGARDEGIKLWNVATGQNTDIEDKGISSLAFSPDGTLLASNKHVWNVETGQSIHTFDGISASSLAFSPDGTLLASNKHVWNVETGQSIHTFDDISVFSLAFSPDGTILAVGSIGKLKLWDVKTKEYIVPLDGHASYIRYVSFSLDQTTLLSKSRDGTVLLWDMSPYLTPTTPPPDVHTLTEDVNKDGTVNIIDLTLVASNFGKSGQNSADVNGDGVVNIIDLTLVAGTFGTTAGAPSIWNLSQEIVPTRTQVEQWLRQARQMNLTDPAFQRGILILKQLLALLTPKETALLPNYPNPFNPETWIPYQLAKSAKVSISIYATDGRLVRRLDLGHQAVGIYESRSRAAYWDGRNAFGEPVASGVYFYTLTAGDFTATRKMLIRK